MKHLTLKKRLLVALPAFILLILGTVVWNLKILAIVAIAYLFVAEFLLKKQHQAEKNE